MDGLKVNLRFPPKTLTIHEGDEKIQAIAIALPLTVTNPIPDGESRAIPNSQYEAVTPRAHPSRDRIEAIGKTLA